MNLVLGSLLDTRLAPRLLNFIQIEFADFIDAGTQPIFPLRKEGENKKNGPKRLTVNVTFLIKQEGKDGRTVYRHGCMGG